MSGKGYLETVCDLLRQATDELERDNREAKLREINRMLQIHYSHVASLNEWARWEQERREARLVSDDDRRWAMSYTPGPWETDEREHDCPYQDVVIRSAKTSRGICRIWFDDAPVPEYNAEQSANARLIAAAPEMVEALENLSTIIHAAEEQGFDISVSDDAKWESATALLARIKGET